MKAASNFQLFKDLHVKIRQPGRKGRIGLLPYRLQPLAHSALFPLGLSVINSSLFPQDCVLCNLYGNYVRAEDVELDREEELL